VGWVYTRVVMGDTSCGVCSRSGTCAKFKGCLFDNGLLALAELAFLRWHLRMQRDSHAGATWRSSHAAAHTDHAGWKEALLILRCCSPGRRCVPWAGRTAAATAAACLQKRSTPVASDTQQVRTP